MAPMLQRANSKYCCFLWFVFLFKATSTAGLFRALTSLGCLHLPFHLNSTHARPFHKCFSLFFSINHCIDSNKHSRCLTLSLKTFISITNISWAPLDIKNNSCSSQRYFSFMTKQVHLDSFFRIQFDHISIQMRNYAVKITHIYIKNSKQQKKKNSFFSVLLQFTVFCV